MSFPIRPSLLALAAVTAAGCASGGGIAGLDTQLGLPESFATTYRAEPTIHRMEVSAPISQVLDAVPLAYQDLGLPAVPDDRMSQTFTTPTLQIQGRLYEGEKNSEYFSCGSTMSGERADQSELEFVARSRVRAGESGGSVVETVLGAVAQDRYTGTGSVACRSTGRLEMEIERRIQGRLGT